MKLKTLILTLGLIVVSAVWTAAGDEPIKIGAVLSVTGPASPLGEPEKNTMEMVAEEINARGGVLGRPLELIILDDETDVNKAVLAAQRLLKKDQVAVVLGPTTSGNALAVKNFFPGAKVPLIACAAAEKIVTPAGPWVFKVAPSDRHAILRILAHAKSRGYKKVALLTVSDGFGQAGRQALKELVPAQGLEIVADEVYGPKDTDMTAQLTKIKGLAPDAIICWGTNPGPAVIAKNRVQLGVETPLYMSHGVASKKFIELAGEAADGVMLPAGKLIVAEQLADDDPQKPLLVKYAKEYQEKFKAPVSTFGGHGWDSLRLAVAAIEKGGSAEPGDIRNNLEALGPFAGVGGVFDYTPEDHNGQDEKAFEMVIIDKGDWKILKD
jgi:branched-chain amino acid transport system substrate-binding protein